MSKINKAIVCGGCFWGIEENFRTKPGVISTEVAYAGGLRIIQLMKRFVQVIPGTLKLSKLLLMRT